MEVHFDGFLFFLEDLTLVRTRFAMKVQETIAVCTQVAALGAQDDGRGLSIIMVVTGGLGVG